MNQPTFKTAFKLIIVVIITLGLSLALQSILAQQAWTNPTCTPPGCNVPAPINVGSSTAPSAKTQGTYDNLNVAASSTMTGTAFLGVAGKFTVNSADGALFVDNNAPYNNVGIGSSTNLLAAKLTIDMGIFGGIEGLRIRRKSVSGFSNSYLNVLDESANTIFQVNQTGNVGIGITNPKGRLHTVGLNATPPNMAYLANGYSPLYVQSRTDATYGLAVFDAYANTAIQSGDVANGTNPTALILNPFGGNVGIGTSTPAYKLDVQGGLIRAGGGLILEVRTTDPVSPVNGQMWLRQ